MPFLVPGGRRAGGGARGGRRRLGPARPVPAAAIAAWIAGLTALAAACDGPAGPGAPYAGETAAARAPGALDDAPGALHDTRRSSAVAPGQPDAEGADWGGAARPTDTPDPWATNRPLARVTFEPLSGTLPRAAPPLATARALLALGPPEAARAAMEGLAAAPGPAYVAAHIHLAAMALQDGDPAAAFLALERAAGPDGAASLPAEGRYRLAQALEAIGEHRGAARAYAAFGEAAPEMSGVAQMAAGQALFAAGANVAAAEAFAVARDQAADPAAAFLGSLRRGNAMLRFAVLEDVLAAYDDAYELATSDQQRAQALDGRIAAYTRSGQPERAEAERLRLVRTLAGTELAALALGKLAEAGVEVGALDRAAVWNAAGEHDAAVEALEASGPPPGTAAAAWLLELARGYLGRGDDLAALALLEEALAAPAVAAAVPGATAPALGGDTPRSMAEAAWLRAETLARLGRRAEAGAAYADLAAAWPDDERAHQALRRRAVIQHALAGPVAAAEALAEAAQRFPSAAESPEDAFRAAFLAWRGGRADQASARLAVLAAEGDPAFRARALYWQGLLALEAGRVEVAAGLWREALDLESGTYYALRAAERLGVERAPPPVSGDADGGMAAWLASWRGRPSAGGAGDGGAAARRALSRARVWLALGERAAALAEMNAARRAGQDDPPALAVLAVEAADLGLTAASAAAAERLLVMAGTRDRERAPAALWHLAYPRAHEAEVLGLAAANGLAPGLLWSMALQESRFEPTARSSAGALGLTQVMPETGRDIAAALGDQGFQSGDLRRPEVALRYGAWYLGRQMERYGGRPWLALAAYNGGPGNADRWLADAGTDQDVFVEAVDFRETRLYLRRTLLFLERYAWLYPDGA